MQHYDVIIIGGGPVGLTFAATLARSALRVAVLEQLPRAVLEHPPFDGREIALTQASLRTLREAGVWQHIPEAEISPLRAARVWNSQRPRPLDIVKRDPQAPLGALVSNQWLRQAAWRSASSLPNISFYFGSRVVGLDVVDGGAAMQVTLQDDTRLQASLTVSADSRFSSTRRAAGISANSRDFGRTMLVCRMRHSQPHDGTAWEWFADGQTLAVLPLNGGHQSSIVVTVDERQAQQLLQASPAEFNADLQRRFQNRLGAMELCSERHAYPLVGVYADRFVATRHALIGDAAVGMHPVTAHGFNLGLLGQTTLAREILTAASRGQDIGAPELLSRYQRAHRRASLPLYLATNSLVKLYTGNAPPLRFAREALLQLAQNVKPFSRALAARL